MVKEDKEFSEGRELVQGFVDDSPELMEAAILYVARVCGPVEEKDFERKTLALVRTLIFESSMLRLIETEKLVYVGDKRYASDDHFVKGILSVVKRERDKITAKLKKKKG